ncbi:MAG: DUF427 domain-containing protein [Trueperaceae bacterium]|nr:DUF427 domain-containing protein [Trueperaceae bacterium]
MPKATYANNVIARSDDVETVEGNLYFPRASVDMSLLEPSTTASTCPWKGAAQYFHLRVGDTRIEDAAWSYPEPKPAAQAIAGHLAFDIRRGLEVG